MSARQQSNLAHRQPLRLLLLSSTACLLVLPLAARAQVAPNQLPTGGTVVGGSATISQPNAKQLTIDQSSQRAIINWQGFNIGANAQVTFNQPNASAIALNRVLSANPTTIAGKLTANGQVFLVNPSGITFANGSQVDVGGLVASTMSISDANFLAGKELFERNGSTAGVTNDGTLTAGPGGFIGLLAPQIRNEGVISARLGTVVLAAGEAVTLDFNGDGNLSVKVDPATVKTLIENHHLIAAPDGQVFMSAQAAGVLMGGIINNRGVIEADSLHSDGGKVTLAASGNITNTGTIAANGAAGGGTGNGGSISVVAGGTAKIGGTLSARGGALGGNGGTIETSGKTVSIKSAKIDTRAPKGATGSWVLDPIDLTVISGAGTVSGSGGSFTSAPGASTVSNANIESALATTNVTLATGGSSGDGQGNGDIFVEAPIAWSASTSLTLTAFRDIQIDAGITKTGTGGGLILTPDAGGAGGGLTVGSSGVVTLNSDAALKIAGQNYTLVTSAAGLQNINNNTDGNYALDGDINMTGVTFNPLGGTLGFTGNFEGLGHSVSYLTVGGANTTKVGLFSDNEGSINDLRLVNVTASGYQYVGGVAGFNGGTITNTDVSGVVYGASGPEEQSFFFGGLAGYNKGTIRNDASGVDMGGTQGFQDETEYVGGLVGTNAGLIDSSSASGPVNHGYFVLDIGGLVGENSYIDANGSHVGTITNSSASGVVTAGTGGDAGGLVGMNGGYYYNSSTGGAGTAVGGNIINSFASGDVHTTMQGENYGGVIGENIGGTVTGITYTGTMETVFGGTNIGGLIGANGFTAINGPPIAPTVSGLVANLTIDTGPAQNPRAMIQTNDVGGAVGANYGTITDSQATVNIIGQGFPSSTGGLVGANYGTISGSSSAGTIATIGNTTGGLVGSNTLTGYRDLSDNSAHAISGTIENSSSSVAITNSGGIAGGIAGENDGVIANSSSTSRISATATNGAFMQEIGGLVGLNQVNHFDVPGNNTYVPVYSTGTITGGVASGVVQGNYQIGGAAGVNGAGASITGVTALDYVVSNNIATPNNGTNFATYIGGFAGENDGTITNGVTSGWVSGATGSTNVGGFVGWNSVSGIITNAHSNDGVTITGTAIGGLVGKNDGQIQGTGGSYSLSLGAITAGPGSQEVGGLVGENNASISSSYAGGSLFSWGGQEIGGLIGNNTTFGLALNSFSVINIQVDGVGTAVGGLVGNNTGTIQHTQSWDPLSAGSGSSDVGGLAGLNSGSIASSLAAGDVTVANSAFNVGGLVGLNHDGTLTTDTAQGDVTVGQNAQNIGSLIGHDESGTIINSSGSGAVTAGSGSTDAGGQIGQESP